MLENTGVESGRVTQLIYPETADVFGQDKFYPNQKRLLFPELSKDLKDTAVVKNVIQAEKC